MRNRDSAAAAIQFENFVGQLIEPMLAESGVRIDSGGDLGVDFIGELPSGSLVLIEVKAYTPSTRSRIWAVVRQMQAASELASKEHPVRGRILAIAGVLSEELQKLVTDNDISLWDGRRLRREAESRGVEIPPDVDLARVVSLVKPEGMRLAGRLRNVKPGKGDWVRYQALCGEILTYLFQGVLESPISEMANFTRVNRRDFILPNYSTDGFWNFMRLHYKADYVVVDAKNYSSTIKKEQVLQIANYLTVHGPGLFGVILTRSGTSGSADWTQREQWVLHSKLVVVLTDDDLRQMLTAMDAQEDPSIVVRQKIEDFRLSL